MYAVTITDKRLGGTTVYGPYRTLAKAQVIADLAVNPHAVGFHDPELYEVQAVKLRAWED